MKEALAEIVVALPEPVEAMTAITDQARANMAAMGIDQWQCGYPSRDTWEADVADGMASVRIDTHGDNAPMRRAVEKFGFAFCGDITLVEGPEAGAPRIAFEKALS